MIKYLLIILLIFASCAVYRTKEFLLTKDIKTSFSIPEIFCYKSIWGLSKERINDDRYNIEFSSPFGSEDNYLGYLKSKVSIRVDSISIIDIKTKTNLFHFDSIFYLDQWKLFNKIIIPNSIDSIILKYSLSVINKTTDTILDIKYYSLKYYRHETSFLFLMMD